MADSSAQDLPISPHPLPPASRGIRTPPRVTYRDRKEVDHVLGKLAADTGYRIECEPGVRRLLCPPDLLPQGGGMVSQRGCEVFVGRLPKDVTEDELFNLFSPFGRIREIRLMISPHLVPPSCSPHNRGFAFVGYTLREDAQTAINTLQAVQIRPGHYIGVRQSVDNNRLFMGGLPRDKTKEEFEAEIRKNPHCSGMLQVIMYPSVSDRGRNRGFAFVEFASHRHAAIARRQLMKEKLSLWGKDICVDWAQPEAEVEPETMAQVCVLYVRNLQISTTEEKLGEVFGAVDGVAVIEKVKKLRDFAFIHFKHRSEAERALGLLNGAVIDDSVIEVTWAKPPAAKQRQQLLLQQQYNQLLGTSSWHHNSSFRHTHSGYTHAHLEFTSPMHPPQTFQNPVHYFGNYAPPPPQQRHYRNAAGTKRRFARPNGLRGPEFGDVCDGSEMTVMYNNPLADTYGRYPVTRGKQQKMRLIRLIYQEILLARVPRVPSFSCITPRSELHYHQQGNIWRGPESLTYKEMAGSSRTEMSDKDYLRGYVNGFPTYYHQGLLYPQSLHHQMALQYHQLPQFQEPFHRPNIPEMVSLVYPFANININNGHPVDTSSVTVPPQLYGEHAFHYGTSDVTGEIYGHGPS